MTRLFASRHDGLAADRYANLLDRFPSLPGLNNRRWIEFGSRCLAWRAAPRAPWRSEGDGGMFVLTDAQRQHWTANGWLLLPRILVPDVFLALSSWVEEIAQPRRAGFAQLSRAAVGAADRYLNAGEKGSSPSNKMPCKALSVGREACYHRVWRLAKGTVAVADAVEMIIHGSSGRDGACRSYVCLAVMMANPTSKT